MSNIELQKVSHTTHKLQIHETKDEDIIADSTGMNNVDCSHSQVTKKWICEKCEFNENSMTTINCQKCNSCTLSLRIIETVINNVLNSILDSNNNKLSSLSVDHFINILKLFKNDHFKEYHSVQVLENLLLNVINLIIGYNCDNNGIKINLLKAMFDHKV